MSNLEFNSDRWVTLSEIATTGELACIDGRHPGCIVGAPGGSMGEFILLLSAAEHLLGREFTGREIHDWLLIIAGRFGRFYMHTDDHAVARLRQALSKDRRLKSWLDPHEDLHGFFTKLLALPMPLRRVVRPYLLQPEHIGCGHLRLLIENADACLTRQQLVADALSSFFTLLWTQPYRMNYAMLEGDHQEQGVVTIDTISEISAETSVPVSCKHNSRQHFVNHQVARNYFMRQSCQVVEEALEGELLATDLECEVNRIAAIQMESILNTLAKNLPLFRLVV